MVDLVRSAKVQPIAAVSQPISRDALTPAEPALQLELPAISGKRPRGRPPKVNALTPAERGKRYRERHRTSWTYAQAFKAGHWPFPTTSREPCP